MKKLLTFLTLLTLFFGVSWAAESVYYTLTPTNGSNNSYAGNCDVTINGITWNVTGNTQILPWRLGGNGISQVSRNIYSKTAMGSKISKIEVEIGEANITLVQIQLTVSSTADFSNVIDVQSKTLTANTTYEFTPTAGTEWTTGAYYKFALMVTNTASKNKYVEFSGATFYKNDSGTPTCATPTFTPDGGTFYEPQTVTISSSTDGATIYYTTDGNTPDPATSQSVANNGTVTIDATCTLTAIATATGYDPSSVASATYTIFEPETVTPTYEQSLISGFGKFYYVDKTNPTTSAIWKSNNYGAVASGQISGTKYDTESWLYTPYIDLTNATNPELSFSHAGNYFTDVATMQSDVQVMVRQLNGTTWSDWSDLTIDNWPDGTSWTFVDNTTSLSAYAGKTIQIAFKYTSSTSRAGTWEIKNFKVQDNDPSAPSYYLVGSFNMDGNTWVTGDEDYKFEESNGTYVLNNVNFDAANTTFKIIKIENGQTTWYGGTGDVDYNIHHTHHENLPMNGGQNYKIQSAGVTSFSFTVSDNTPGNLNVNRDAKLYIKGGFNNWEEELMTVSSGEWTTSQTIAENQEFGFVDEFGQWRGKEWTIYSEHMNGYEIPVETSGNYKMGVAGTYTLSVNSELTKLVVNSVTGDVYTLVESATDLVAGQEYLIVDGTDYKAILGPKAGNNNNTYATAVYDKFTYNPTEKTITVEDGCTATPVTLGGNETDGWTFQVSEDVYLAYNSTSTSGNNYLHFVDGEKNGRSWAIDTQKLPSNKLLINNKYNDARYIMFNDGNTRFAAYLSSSSMTAVALFKKGSATPSNKTATPVITPDSKDVKGGLLEGITITAGEEGTTPVIYYTTDDSDPGDASNANRVQYTEPFDMQVTQGGPQTVKAIAIEDGKDPSSIASVTYTFKNPAAPTFTPDPAVVQTGDFTVTINSEDGGTIYYVLDPDANEFPSNSEEAIATGQIYDNGVAVSGYDTHKIYAAVLLNGLKSSLSTATYTIIEVGAEGDWQLVTSVDQITDGYDYIIVNSDHDRAIKSGALETSRFYSVECENNVVFGPNFATATVAGSDVRIFGFETEGDNIYMKDADNSRYYNFATDVSTGKQPVYITMADGFVYIKGAAEATKSLAYNTANGNYFGIYATPTTTTGSQRPIYLYRRGVQQTPSMTLADICKYGVTTEGKNEYIIADKLQAVYAYTKGGNSLLWCKDLGNKSIVPTTIHSGQIDFMREPGINTDTEGVHNGQQGPWDQSNWIVLQFTNPTGSNNIDEMLRNAQDKFIKPGTIKGKLVDDENYILKMDLDQLELVTQADPDYDEEPYNENVYCPANFLPENLNIHDGIENGDGAQSGNVNYFFMNPKVQEICYITYAQWDNDLKYFSAPSSSGIDGAFQVGWVYQDQPALESGKIYKFHAVVHRVGKEYGPQNPVSTKDGMPVYANITVLPIDLTADSEVVTSINTVETGNGEVKSVKYVNVSGMVSDVPFQGVNIVVTEYTDGSRSTSKMLRK